jgi:hypothetical protein
MFRWTIKELQEMSDLEIIRRVLTERKSTLTNYYSPLNKKLTELSNKIDRKIIAGHTEI